MKKLGTEGWFLFMSVAAFISVISFFQIDSYWADKHHFNGFFGWLGIGIVFGLVAIYGLKKVKDTEAGGDGGSSV